MEKTSRLDLIETTAKVKLCFHSRERIFPYRSIKNWFFFLFIIYLRWNDLMGVVIFLIFILSSHSTKIFFCVFKNIHNFLWFFIIIIIIRPTIFFFIPSSSTFFFSFSLVFFRFVFRKSFDWLLIWYFLNGAFPLFDEIFHSSCFLSSSSLCTQFFYLSLSPLLGWWKGIVVDCCCVVIMRKNEAKKSFSKKGWWIKMKMNAYFAIFIQYCSFLTTIFVTFFLFTISIYCFISFLLWRHVGN